MTDWQSPQVLAADAASFNNLQHVVLGIYLWEFVTSLDFDWQFISGKKRFKWPLIFYLAGRYSLLLAVIGIAISLNVKTEVNCQALYTFIQVVGMASVGFASINLSIRTIAVWSQNKYVIGLLVVVILVHWTFLLHGVLLQAVWMNGVCVVTQTSNQMLAISFIYSMGFDFLVLCLTGWKLAFPIRGRSRLVTLIFTDGLIYFFVAFLANLLATTFMLLNLNAVMSIIGNSPVAMASTIMACRVVRRLTNFTSEGPEFFTTTANSAVAFRTPQPSSHRLDVRKAEVHIQMDSLVQQTDDKYDSAGRSVKGDEYDPEAQVVNCEFKAPSY